jgi:hypothetical protein
MDLISAEYLQCRYLAGYYLDFLSLDVLFTANWGSLCKIVVSLIETIRVNEGTLRQYAHRRNATYWVYLLTAHGDAERFGMDKLEVPVRFRKISSRDMD